MERHGIRRRCDDHPSRGVGRRLRSLDQPFRPGGTTAFDFQVVTFLGTVTVSIGRRNRTSGRTRSPRRTSRPSCRGSRLSRRAQAPRSGSRASRSRSSRMRRASRGASPAARPSQASASRAPAPAAARSSCRRLEGQAVRGHGHRHARRRQGADLPRVQVPRPLARNRARPAAVSEGTKREGQAGHRGQPVCPSRGSLGAPRLSPGAPGNRISGGRLGARELALVFWPPRLPIAGCGGSDDAAYDLWETDACLIDKGYSPALVETDDPAAFRGEPGANGVLESRTSPAGLSTSASRTTPPRRTGAPACSRSRR